MSSERDYARDLYPFLYAPTSDAVGSGASLLETVRQSTLAKCADVIELRSELLAEYDVQLVRVARLMADRFARAGKLLAFGNGGSATDADDAAADCMRPPSRSWRSLPALSLPSDSATLSAMTNDVGLASVFARQIGALGAPDDIAVGFSTSGNSENVVAAFAEARKRGLLTVAFSGYDGGAVARSGSVDACFVARREFVPRIQEGHATLWHVLLGLVQDAMAEDAQECR